METPNTEYRESTNPRHFHQYVELRRRAFLRRYPWLNQTFGMPDRYDGAALSRIVYAIGPDELVRGGARLTVSTPERPLAMPLETASLRLAQLAELSGLGLDRRPYAEISRMAVETAGTGTLRHSRGISRELCRIAAAQGVDVIFSVCPEEAADLNKRNAQALNVSFERQGLVPTPYDSAMYLCVFTGIVHAMRPAWHETPAA